MQQVFNKNQNSKTKYLCSNNDCSAVFKSEESLTEHILKGDRIYLEKHGEDTKLSSMYRVKFVFADKLLSGNEGKTSKHLSGSSSSTSALVNSKELLSLDLSGGWALKARRKAIRFSAEQRRYLIGIFEHDEKIKRKEDPKNVAEMMRKARSPTGAKMFEPSEYLRKEQIASFFSRLNVQKSKGKPFRS